MANSIRKDRMDPYLLANVGVALAFTLWFFGFVDVLEILVAIGLVLGLGYLLVTKLNW